MDLCLSGISEWGVEHWGVLGTWFSGLATSAIGGIAVCLAHPWRPLRLEVRIFRMKVAVECGDEIKETPYWGVAITNRGRQAVTIAVVDWWIRKRKTSFKIRLTELGSPTKSGLPVISFLKRPPLCSFTSSLFSARLGIFPRSNL